MTRELRILLLEDVPTDARLIEEKMREAGLVFTSRRVVSREDYSRALDEFAPDIVLADNSLPAFDALGAVQLAGKLDPLIPVIVVTGTMLDEQAINLLRAGARDYVLKDRLARLVPAVRRALADAEDARRRKATEIALKNSEQRFRTIFEQAAVGISEATLSGRYLTVNQRLCEITGYASAELLKQTLRDIIHPDDLQKINRNLERLLDGKIPEYSAEIRYIRKDSSIAWVLLMLTPVHDSSGSVHQLVTIVEDINSRKTAEQAFQDSEERFRLLFMSSQDAFMTFEPPEWRFTSCNPSTVTLFGAADKAQILGATPWELSPELQFDGKPSLEKAKLMIQTALRKGSHYFEWVHRRLDGSTFETTVLLTRLMQNGKPLLNASVRDTTERKRARVALHEALVATIEAISATMESRDPYTSGHQKRVARLAAAIAREMGLSDNVVQGVHFGALIHDVGKIQIPSEILSKPGKLIPIEFELIKTHAQSGYDIVKNIKFPWPVADMVYQHHERLDGSGYPRGLKGDAIVLEARILAVADVVEAMATHRPYRPSLGLATALQEVEGKRNTGFDPAAVDACLRLFREKGFVLEG